MSSHQHSVSSASQEPFRPVASPSLRSGVGSLGHRSGQRFALPRDHDEAVGGGAGAGGMGAGGYEGDDKSLFGFNPSLLPRRNHTIGAGFSSSSASSSPSASQPSSYAARFGAVRPRRLAQHFEDGRGTPPPQSPSQNSLSAITGGKDIDDDEWETMLKSSDSAALGSDDAEYEEQLAPAPMTSHRHTGGNTFPTWHPSASSPPSSSSIFESSHRRFPSQPTSAQARSPFAHGGHSPSGLSDSGRQMGHQRSESAHIGGSSLERGPFASSPLKQGPDSGTNSLVRRHQSLNHASGRIVANRLNSRYADAAYGSREEAISRNLDQAFAPPSLQFNTNASHSGFSSISANASPVTPGSFSASAPWSEARSREHQQQPPQQQQQQQQQQKQQQQQQQQQQQHNNNNTSPVPSRFSHTFSPSNGKNSQQSPSGFAAARHLNENSTSLSSSLMDAHARLSAMSINPAATRDDLGRSPSSSVTPTPTTALPNRPSESGSSTPLKMKRLPSLITSRDELARSAAQKENPRDAVEGPVSASAYIPPIGHGHSRKTSASSPYVPKDVGFAQFERDEERAKRREKELEKLAGPFSAMPAPSGWSQRDNILGRQNGRQQQGGPSSFSAFGLPPIPSSAGGNSSLSSATERHWPPSQTSEGGSSLTARNLALADQQQQQYAGFNQQRGFGSPPGVGGQANLMSPPPGLARLGAGPLDGSSFGPGSPSQFASMSLHGAGPVDYGHLNNSHHHQHDHPQQALHLFNTANPPPLSFASTPPLHFAGLAPMALPSSHTPRNSSPRPDPRQDPAVSQLIQAKGYNPTSIDLNPANTRFFVIKSYTEDDVQRSLKYEIWASTEKGNARLDKAFRESIEGKEESQRGRILLFFSVNASGHFCGMAEMLTPLDYSSSSNIWAQEGKWKGTFKVKWIFVKDVPNNRMRHIRLTNTPECKPVTQSRDTQELPQEAGKEVMKIMAEYTSSTSLLQDWLFYEEQAAARRQQEVGG